MHPAVEIAWVLALAALLVAVLRWSGWLWLAAPVAALDGEGPRVPADGGEDEQLPETDRAPRRGLQALTCTVALTAAVRLGLFVALHR
ncbi:MAG TPA: hypothetical protein VEQ15_15380 [Myxococcales bacterium]|nr:hypothetical protein [Myxococcales bacterium]